MARIKWLNHPNDPQKNGTLEHVSRNVAELLVTLKQAELSPYRGYVDFLSSTAREGHDAHNVNPPSVLGLTWECVRLGKSSRPCILRKQGGEVIRIENEQQAIQAGTPELILKKFRELDAEKDKAIEALVELDRAKREQVLREAQDRDRNMLAALSHLQAEQN